jgi:hypothetical protein
MKKEYWRKRKGTEKEEERKRKGRKRSWSGLGPRQSSEF